MRKKVFIAIGILLFVVSVVYISTFFKKKDVGDNTNPLSETGVDYNRITPNKSTRDDLYNTFGDPIKQEAIDGIDGSVIFEYKSNNPNFNNEFKLDSNTVSFIKRHTALADNVRTETFNKDYGEFENILYGPSSQSGFNLYLYNTKGIAYVGNQYTGDVVEVWYFPPTNDMDQFIKDYAPEYSKTDNPKTY